MYRPVIGIGCSKVNLFFPASRMMIGFVQTVRRLPGGWAGRETPTRTGQGQHRALSSAAVPSTTTA